MRSQAPRNVYGGAQNATRAPLERERVQQSRVSDQRWRDLERDLVRFIGRDSGRAMFRILRRGERDYPFFCEKVLGVRPWPWQARVWDALQGHLNVIVRGPNGVGKTVDYGLVYFHVATYRDFADDNWGAVGIRHLGPLQAHANKALYKMQDILAERAREQAFRVKGGWKFRPCLISQFVSEGQLDGYPALDFFAGSAYAAFSPSANGATSADGDEPVVVGWDEVRHETNVRYVVDVIIQPRYLRVPDGRFLVKYTPDIDGNPLAAVELSEMFRRGQQGRRVWYSFAVGLDENRSITARAKERVAESITDERSRAQAMRGEEVQPARAFFNFASIARAIGAGPELAATTDLGDGVCACSSCDGKRRSRGGPLGVRPLRARVAARCPECRRRDDGELSGHEHAFAAFGDPASSAQGADAIAFTVWDLEPAGFDGAEVVYAEALAPGTEIGDIVRHADAISLSLGIEVGYDGKGGLGHALKDELFKTSGTFVPLRTDTEGQKDDWLRFLKALLEKNALRGAFHGRTVAQLSTYVRRDRKIAQDFVLAQAGCAQMAMPDLPERVFEAEGAATAGADIEDARLDGLGGADDDGDVDEVYGDVEEGDLLEAEE